MRISTWKTVHSLRLLLLRLGPVAAISQRPLVDLRERSIYQIVTDRFARGDGVTTYCDPAEKKYCGGDWRGIINGLDYIQGMGFDTIWISPIVQNIELEGSQDPYHGYWAADIYEINNHFGTRDDLLSLSKALHTRGMYLMVDVVANHLGTQSLAEFKPGKMYGPFTLPEDFHRYCTPSNWENQIQIEQCWIANEMPDLNTESPRVVKILSHWIHELVKFYEIDFIRIDTVKHVRKTFWPEFVKSAGIPAMGEVLHGDPTYLAGYQRESMASLLDFATFFHLRRAFESTSGSIESLGDMVGRIHRLFPDPTLLGSFLDNHDFERLAGLTTDPVLLKNAAVYSFVSDGFPVVYQGTEHALKGGQDPMNREAIWLSGFARDTELYIMFRTLNQARKTATMVYPPFIKTHLKYHLPNNRTIVLTKSPLLTILTNYGSTSSPVGIHLTPSQTMYKPLIPVIDILSGHILSTDQRGGLTVPILAGQPRVFLPLSIHSAQSTTRDSWLGRPLSIEVPNRHGHGDGTGSNAGSPQTPGRSHRRTPSIGRVLSWFGKSNDL